MHHFYDHLCAYCLIRTDGIQVEHYVPKSFAPQRKDDPTNLLVACSRCNGSGCKADYHPDYVGRRYHRGDTTGHYVIDLRVDDFAALFAVDEEGGLRARPGESCDRAQWNIVLLKLDSELLGSRRKELLELRDLCEFAQAAIGRASSAAEAERLELMLEKILATLARHLLFFEVYGLAIGEDVAKAAMERRDALRGETAEGRYG